jgi:hypothetical protein
MEGGGGVVKPPPPRPTWLPTSDEDRGVRNLLDRG